MLHQARRQINGRAAGRWVLALAVVSFFVRLRIAERFLRTPYHEFTLHVSGPDQNRFLLWAERIREGVWTAPGESPSAPFQFSPVYSWLLSLSLSREAQPFLGIFLLQAGLSAAAGLAVWDCGRRLGCRAAGLAAAVVWLFYGPSIFFDGCVIRESLIASTGIIGFWAALAMWDRPSAGRGVWAGALLGAGMALRAHFFFPAVLAVFAAAAWRRSDRRRLLCAAVCAVAFLAVNTPVAVRNLAVSGRFVPLPTQGADALILGNDLDGPGVTHVPTERSARLMRESGGSFVRAAGLIARDFAADPGSAARLYARKLRMLVNAHETPANYSYYVWRFLLPEARRPWADWGWLAGPALLGLWFALRSRSRFRLAAWAAAAFLAGAALVHIQARYRFPAVPFVALLAGFGVVGMWHLAKKKRWTALILCAAVLAAATAATRPDPSFGYYRVTGSDGVRRLNTDPILESDYVTLLVSWALSGAEAHRDVIRVVSNRAARSYGLSVVAQFDTSVHALNADLAGTLSRAYREKYKITRI